MLAEILTGEAVKWLL